MTCPSCGAVLPEPPERFCPSCGVDLEAPPSAAEWPLAKPEPARGTPWEDRRRTGVVQALVETTQRVLTSPSDFFASMPVTGGIGAPLLYGILVGTLGVIVAALYREVFRALMGSAFMGFGGTELRRVMPFLMGGFGLVLQVIFAPIFVILGLFIVSAIVHLFLLMLGGARRGFEATFRVMCYGEAAAVINIIPLCGGFVSGIYYMVLAIIGLAAAHGIGRGTAAAAVLLPLVVLCCCCAGAGILAFGGLASLLSQVK